jgi:hypothetical protein
MRKVVQQKMRKGVGGEVEKEGKMGIMKVRTWMRKEVRKEVRREIRKEVGTGKREEVGYEKGRRGKLVR